MAEKQDRIEEVKKICKEHRVYDYLFPDEVDALAHQICQLFEKPEPPPEELTLTDDELQCASRQIDIPVYGSGAAEHWKAEY